MEIEVSPYPIYFTVLIEYFIEKPEWMEAFPCDGGGLRGMCVK